MARDLRSDKGLGIIILTARTTREDRVRAYEEGADLYISKPVDGAELVLAVPNLAGRLPRPSDPAVAPPPADAWTLNSQQGRLFNPQGGAVALTPRELLLLELLADAGQDIVGRDQLDRTLGYDGRSASRGLDALMQRLRTKAEAEGMALPLQVIRSIGVRLIKPLHKA